jgi:homocysteine S-methyltransferase
MSYPPLKQRLDAGQILILDGATGTELQRRGAKMDPSAWSAPVVLEDPKLLTEVHADYIRAGADIVTANTFSASRMLLAPTGYGARVEEIIRRSVEVAQQARTLAAAGRPVAVAGSISHMVPVVKGANRTDPTRLPSDAEIGDSVNELAETLRKSGLISSFSK